MSLQPSRFGAQPQEILLSVIIPVHNPGNTLEACLMSLSQYGGESIEIIVVDDGCTDNSMLCAAKFGAKIVRTGLKIGPGRARNLGASVARGSVLLFLDGDVCIHADTIRRIRRRFAADWDLAALIGSYDNRPGDPGFVSQYRNLLHHHIHQNGCEGASTFWSGCGAIRNEVFEEFGGFSAVYDHASIEDIELGYRLTSSGRSVLLDREIQVTHLKRWRLWKMLKTDIARRGIPWMKLILRDRRMPNDLNLRVSQRLSVLMIYVALFLAAMNLAALVLPLPEHLGLWSRYAGVCAVLSIVTLNVRFYLFLLKSRGLSFLIGALPLHFAYFLCNGISFLAGTTLYVPQALRGLSKRRESSRSLKGSP